MGEDNVLCLSEKMLPSKHSTTKYGRATMAVAMAACILGIVTMVTQVVVVLEVRNLRSELGTKMESVLDVMHPKGLRQSRYAYIARQSSDIIAENEAEDTGTKSWQTGKESHHRAKRSDHASKSTVRESNGS
ncbi:uncharacterized protein [Branchiostoma lanceolatum]|uniref:uncharacterized protein n=1 Tax=Branchiostoma lanceolatum TaxID=7740 RepID=UPI0034530FF3